MDQLRLAWAAGFLDGEGWFGFKVVERKGQRSPGIVRRRAVVAAAQVTRAPLDRLAETLGGRVSGDARRTVTGKTVWQWNLAGTRQIETAIAALLPYLIVKHDVAELLLAHVSTFTRSGSIRLSPEVLALRARIESQARLLTASGREWKGD
jgi:hypothetical protein